MTLTLTRTTTRIRTRTLNQEAKRQEREEASAGGDLKGGAVKAEGLAERRETFSERWAKAVAEAHPSAAVHPRPTLTLT